MYQYLAFLNSQLMPSVIGDTAVILYSTEIGVLLTLIFNFMRAADPAQVRSVRALTPGGSTCS